MQENNKRVTIYDIANKIGVSSATVNRALTNKPGVSKNMRERVRQTAKQMGYKTNKLAQGLKRKPVNIGFVMRNSVEDYNGQVLRGAQKACAELADYNVHGDFCILDSQNIGSMLTAKLIEFTQKDVDAVIFCPSGAVDIEDAVSKLTERGIKLGTVITDSGQNEIIFSVTPNANRAARMAADLFSLYGLKEGAPVALFIGSKEHILHTEYIKSFIKANEQYGYKIIEIIDHRNDARMAYYAAEQLLTEHPYIEGIYCCTVVTTPICDKVVEMGLQDRIKIIGTDLTPNHVDHLQSGVLSSSLFLDPFQQGYKAFMYMYKHLSDGIEIDRNVVINPQIVIRGNLDYYIPLISG